MGRLLDRHDAVPTDANASRRCIARRAFIGVVPAVLLAGCSRSRQVVRTEPGSYGAAIGSTFRAIAARACETARERVLPSEDEIRAQLDIVEDYRPEFAHGPKGPQFQRYIMLHDTEGGGTPESVVSYWDSTDNGVAAHFVIGKDGHVVQCVPLDEIAHHAGFGDTGHNELYGTTDESRDDRVGTVPIGTWASDYGMNSYSVGIELIHRGGEGDYPSAQLKALDGIISLIDAHYGFESDIIDHKAWRTGNSDTSAEFASYLANYQAFRSHQGEMGE